MTTSEPTHATSLAAHRLCRRLLRRPHRCRRPVVDALIARRRPRRSLIFETLAERTLALAQLRAPRAIPTRGYEPLLDAMLRPVLARCLAHGIRIVSNFGAANPRGAARRIARAGRASSACRRRASRWSRATTCPAPAQRAAAARAARRGSSTACARRQRQRLPRRRADRRGAARRRRRSSSAGRVADPSLDRRPGAGALRLGAPTTGTGSARATMAGHLLECGAQVSGGYFADPGYKDVPGLARVGFPIAEIDADGDCMITKADGTGGRVDAHTVKEQLLYEVHDPAAYLTPDVVADIAEADVDELGADRVRAVRRARPCAAGDAQGQRLLRRRLARRGRDLLRRRRAPRRARGWPPTCCASACDGLRAARRPDRRRSACSATTPAAARGDARRRRARRAPARRAAHADRARGRAPGARGDRALHLRPGRRRRRAHRAAPAPQHAVVPACRASAVPRALRDARRMPA